MTTGAAALCIRVQLRCEGLSTSCGRSINSIFFKYNSGCLPDSHSLQCDSRAHGKINLMEPGSAPCSISRGDRGELTFHGVSFRSADQVATTAYLSSHTSSKRQPLYWLLLIIISPLTSGCQQVAAGRS